VKLGDRVKAGESVIAVLSSKKADSAQKFL
jgi:hypothetical protein